jgi:hypothetical protein
MKSGDQNESSYNPERVEFWGVKAIETVNNWKRSVKNKCTSVRRKKSSIAFISPVNKKTISIEAIYFRS